MNFLHMESLSLTLLICIFLTAACFVWWAGFRISIYANSISNRTGIGKAFIGALLLGAITSLPEVATTITATYQNNVPLAVNNLIGGVTLQVTILAIADFYVKKTGVTTLLRRGIILLQGILFIFILTISIVGSLVTDISILGIGLWVWLILLTGVFSFYLIHRYQKSEIFLEIRDPEKRDFVSQVVEGKGDGGELSSEFSNTKLYVFTVLLALGILIGGYFCAHSADILASRIGMDEGFMGIFFLALATSLPELSTSISAIRIRQYDLAFSDIFGTNIFDILLIFFADIVYADGLVMNEIQNFSVVGAAIGIAITTIFLIGILIKSRRRIGNFGLDSILAMVIYVAGLYLLYTMKS